MFRQCRPRTAAGRVHGKAVQAVAAAERAQVDAAARPTRDGVRPRPSGTVRLRTGRGGASERKLSWVMDTLDAPDAHFGQVGGPFALHP